MFGEIICHQRKFLPAKFLKCLQNVQIGIKNIKLTKNCFICKNFISWNVFISSIAICKVHKILIQRKFMPLKIYTFKVFLFLWKPFLYVVKLGSIHVKIYAELFIFEVVIGDFRPKLKKKRLFVIRTILLDIFYLPPRYSILSGDPCRLSNTEKYFSRLFLL